MLVPEPAILHGPLVENLIGTGQDHIIILCGQATHEGKKGDVDLWLFTVKRFLFVAVKSMGPKGIVVLGGNSIDLGHVLGRFSGHFRGCFSGVFLPYLIRNGTTVEKLHRKQPETSKI